MEVKCFGCDTMVQAGRVDEVADAFVTHGRDNHTWSYPEEAIRTYARNYAEATQRLTGSTERLSEIPAVSIRPVTKESIEDWLRFFDHDGCAGNPDWASCYCLEPHAPPPPENPESPWRERRAIMIGRFQKGTTYGYLAYAGDRPAGWVNASLRSSYGLYTNLDLEG